MLTPIQMERHQYQWNYVMPMASHVKKSCTFHSNCLNLRNAIVPLMILLHYVTLMPVPVASKEQNVMMQSFQYSWPKEQNMAFVLLPLASCDVNTNADGITSPKMSCCTSFWSSWANKCCFAIGNAHQDHMLPMTSLNSSHDQKSYVAPHFHYLG